MWFPLFGGKDNGECWFEDFELEFGVKEQPIMRAHGVDISRWQDPYKDDGIDEGFPLDFVIQKAADGLDNYTVSLPAWWKPQYESIKHIGIKGFYHYFQTETQGEPQGDICADIADSGLYDFAVVDYESFNNVIDAVTAGELEDFVNTFRARTDVKLVLYTNGWIRGFLEQVLGTAFFDGIDFWYAGGAYYNLERTAPIADNIQPTTLPWKLWQYSADGNKLADELDFGIYELGSIDLDVFNGTVSDMLAWIGLDTAPTPPEPPQSDFSKEMVINDLEGLIAKYRE
jgi:GH25 family lysozyme M1 (1,4-beta-N-acetylmuramidase)